MEPITKEQVIDKLRTVIDPELNVNIIDLGLVYEVDIQGNKVEVTMTMTTPGCPMSNAISGGVQHALNAEANIGSTEVNVVWEPRWNPEMMTDAGKEQLGFL